MNFLEKSLFSTNAIKVADAMSPFWYTSGTIRPYFINTHFLYGSSNDANELLSFIDNNMKEPIKFVNELNKKVLTFYNSNELYYQIVNLFYDSIKNNSNFIKSAYISGGERRDWFFSPVIAHLSGKKHFFIFKNLEVYSLESKITDIKNSNVTHIADLITQASSYERAWIPAIKNIAGNLIFSASVVDRAQGGIKYLKSNGIDCFSSVKVNDAFFQSAKENNVINSEQLFLIKQFAHDPIEYGKNFLIKYPDFLKSSVSSMDKSIKSKAQRCVDENPYKLDFSKWGF